MKVLRNTLKYFYTINTDCKPKQWLLSKYYTVSERKVVGRRGDMQKIITEVKAYKPLTVQINDFQFVCLIALIKHYFTNQKYQ